MAELALLGLGMGVGILAGAAIFAGPPLNLHRRRWKN